MQRAAEAVRPCVSGIFGERVRREGEVGEDREQPFGDGLAATMPEDLARMEILEEIAVLRGSIGHGSLRWRVERGSVHSCP